MTGIDICFDREVHTFHLSCGKMTITLHDVAYQLELNIDGDPVSDCIDGWEQFYNERSIEDFYQELLDNTVCGELEEYLTNEHLLCYTKDYIMQIIRDILFLDTSYSRVHIRLSPLLADLDRCKTLSWGLTVLDKYMSESPTATIFFFLDGDPGQQKPGSRTEIHATEPTRYPRVYVTSAARVNGYYI
ncbi:hypothetical protein AHAS_Ahas12G0029400 [Arachis hypogaea]